MTSLLVEHGRMRIDEIPREMAALFEITRKARRQARLRYGAALALVAVASLALLPVVPPASVFGLFFFIVLIITGWNRGKAIDRKEAKVAFLRDLLESFRDELHPRAPIRYRFDLRAYDAPDKVERTARSATGNLKTYYSDKWLHLRLTLADRTVVEVVRQQGLKTKKGGVVSEKRRLFLTVTPNPRRYWPMQGEPMVNRLRWELRNTVSRWFHNPPEMFHAKVDCHERDLEVRITQEDADILPAEVHALVGCLVYHLAQRCAVRPPGS